MEDPEIVAQRLYRMACEAAAAGLNSLAEEIYQQSQIEVPKSFEEKSLERYGMTLADSGRGPMQDAELAATPEKLESVVVYDQPYAHAVHEGYAIMHRATGEVVWAITDFSTEGTKDHYLEDPLKAAAARLDGIIGAEFETRLVAL